MKSPDVYKDHLLDTPDLSPEEREIITGYIQHRDNVSPTATNTRIRQAAICTWIVRKLHSSGVAVEGSTVHDFLTVAGAANGMTKNSRQTYVFTVKSFPQYLHRFNH